MNRYVIRDSADVNMILGVVETDGCPSMLYEAKEKVVQKLGDDYWTIDDIIVQARKMFPEYSFIYDYKVSGIVL